jgi:hypothetical protein
MTSKGRWAMAAATAPLIQSERGFEQLIHRRFTLHTSPISGYGTEEMIDWPWHGVGLLGQG